MLHSAKVHVPGAGTNPARGKLASRFQVELPRKRTRPLRIVVEVRSKDDRTLLTCSFVTKRSVEDRWLRAVRLLVATCRSSDTSRCISKSRIFGLPR